VPQPIDTTIEELQGEFFAQVKRQDLPGFDQQFSFWHAWSAAFQAAAAPESENGAE
jgi:hypothetical protein